MIAGTYLVQIEVFQSLLQVSEPLFSLTSSYKFTNSRYKKIHSSYSLAIFIHSHVESLWILFRCRLFRARELIKVDFGIEVRVYESGASRTLMLAG